MEVVVVKKELEKLQLEAELKSVEAFIVRKELDELKSEAAIRRQVYLYCEYSKRAMEGQSLSSGLESYLCRTLILFATAILFTFYDSATNLFTPAELLWIKRTYRTSKYHHFRTTPF